MQSIDWMGGLSLSFFLSFFFPMMTYNNTLYALELVWMRLI